MIFFFILFFFPWERRKKNTCVPTCCTDGTGRALCVLPAGCMVPSPGRGGMGQPCGSSGANENPPRLRQHTPQQAPREIFPSQLGITARSPRPSGHRAMPGCVLSGQGGTGAPPAPSPWDAAGFRASGSGLMLATCSVARAIVLVPAPVAASARMFNSQMNE